MTARPDRSLPPAYFDARYAADPDPWRFETSPYEHAKYAATLAALPRSRYAAALEVGCSIGVLTAQLAARCDRLLAVDAAAAPLARARARCAASPGVTVLQAELPGAWPPGRFDLIVLSEVAYYWVRADLEAAARHAMTALLPGGDLLLVHYTGETDYPLTGDEAADGFIAACGADATVTLRSRADRYRLDRLRRH